MRLPVCTAVLHRLSLPDEQHSLFLTSKFLASSYIAGANPATHVHHRRCTRVNLAPHVHASMCSLLVCMRIMSASVLPTSFPGMSLGAILVPPVFLYFLPLPCLCPVLTGECRLLLGKHRVGLRKKGPREGFAPWKASREKG